MSHYNRTQNKISRILQLKATKYNNTFASISQDNTIRQWDFDDFSQSYSVDLSIKNEEVIEEGSKQSSSNQDRIPTAFDCSEEYYAAVGFKDGSLQVNFWLTRFLRPTLLTC
jgi:WD40 repeat protein